MASNEVKIKVIIDSHTYSLKAARKDVNELGKSLANTDTVANALKGTFGKIALSLGGVTALGVAVKNVATSGIEANRSFENLKIQLTGLISANSSNVSLLGKTLDAHSKWNLGMAESEKILKKLNETNAKTKFTLEEIAGAFNMFYATSAGQGSRDKAVQAMDSIALAAQAVGKNIRDLTPMMDSLSTGTVIAASEMGSFMKIVGLSNEELKKANENGKVYDYLIEKLAKFKELSGEAANGYEVALGSLKNELTELNKELSKPIFGALTTGMVTFSNLLRENKDDLVKYGGYAIETMKHLGLLAGSFIAAKGAVIALSGAFSMIKGAIAAAAAMMPAFTSSLTLSITTGVVLEKGLATLNRAFATLLPAATIYLLYESIDAIKVLNGNLEDGAKNLNSVQKWIYRFLDSFTTQLQIGHIKIYQFINDLKIMALKAKEFFDSINPFGRGEGAKDAQKDIALLEKYNQAYDELIEKYKQGAVAKELNLQGFKLDENGNILTDAKQKVDKLKDSIDKLGGSAGNAGKKDLNAMKAALKDIAEVNFSDMELKTQRVIDRYNEILSLGIDKGRAKHFLDSKLEAIANENIKAVEKSEAEAIAKQLDLRVEYYKTIGEYERAWQIEKQKIIEKYEKLTFANGEKLTKEQLDKLLKMEKTAFLQGAKIAKNSFKDIKGSWADTVSTMSKTVEDKFFDFFIGKTKSLKSALKDIGQNLFRDFMSPYARGLSQGIGGLFGSFLGGGSNLAQLASFYGLSKSDAGSFVGEVAGTAVEIASDGTIVKGGSAFGGASNILSMASNLKSAYTMLTNGYSGMISSFTAPMVSWGGQLINAGYGTLGSAVGGFGGGVHGALTGSLQAGSASGLGALGNVGYIGGASLAGGALGYGVGTLGDRLFKANSYASSVGAVGGALGGMASAGAFGAKIGSMVGPWGAVIGAVAGALIGGMFGKKKVTGSGLAVLEDINAGDTLSNQNIRSYVDMQRKGWFSKKSWTEYSDLDADTMSELQKQISSVNRLAMRAGALSTLKIAASKYSNDSFGDVGIAKAVIKSMTGQEDKVWAEVIESGGKKRKGLLNKISNVFEKVMKFSPSSIINKALEPVDKAMGNVMKGSFLGRIHEESIKWRKEIGNIGDGNTFGSEGAKSIDKMLNLTEDVKNKNLKLIDNPELERMYKDWQELAKKENKTIIELMSQSLGAISDTYKNLEAMSEKNTLKQAQISMRQTFESFIDSAQALKVKIPENLADITELSVERMTLAYHEAIANDFTKENVDSLNSLVKAYDSARQAQENFTKTVISFTNQIAQTQSGFYQAHGIDTGFLNYQNITTKFKVLINSLGDELGDLKGNGSDLEAWRKTLINMSAAQMQTFLGAGDSARRAELVGLVTEYQNLTNSTGGHIGWTKNLAQLEALNQQIDALEAQVSLEKLAVQAQEAAAAQEKMLKEEQERARVAIEAQKEQLNILRLQKSAIEKIAGVARSIRNEVIDRTTAPINYANALRAAREAYGKGNFGSKAFDELGDAAEHQQRYFEDTLGSYEEYKLNMLKMAGEIEDISNKTTLADINAAIENTQLQIEDMSKSLQKEIDTAVKKAEENTKTLNTTLEAQLLSLNEQRLQLVTNSQNEIMALDRLLGTGAPLMRYLREVLEYLINKDKPADAKKEPAPVYTAGVEDIKTPLTTANGAMLLSELDRQINQLYLSKLGRSVEQAGLNYWKEMVNKHGLTLYQVGEEMIKAITAQTGSPDRAIWKEWYKAQGLKPFADGGIVTRPTKALIGEAGYDEAVIPLKDGRGLRVDMDSGFKELTNSNSRLERVTGEMARGVKELVTHIRNIMSEDGESINTRARA